jgi:SAM-dependent methyltransferase
MPSYGYVGDQTRHNAHRLLVELTGANKRVLDVGCASGYLAARLKHAGCRATGIELDPSAARQAEAHCERVIVGRADETALEATGGGFDVILCGDVLSSTCPILRSPWARFPGCSIQTAASWCHCPTSRTHRSASAFSSADSTTAKGESWIAATCAFTR